MSDMNSVCISGRLTRDPVLRNNGNGAAVFTVASNEHYRDKTGCFQERTAFVLIRVFGGRAQTMQNRKKGDMVMVTGKLRTETRDDDSQQSQLVLICDSLQFIKPAPKSESNDRETLAAPPGDEVPETVHRGCGYPDRRSESQWEAV